jgi:glycerol-3-phosphate dehydrogenase (NAD(P)+)
MKPLAILGAGSWGTAIAIHLARYKQVVHLWGRDRDKIAIMEEKRENVRYLPDISLPTSLRLFDDLSKALEDVSDIMLAVPSVAFRSTLHLLEPHVRKDTRIAWTTKGIDPQTNQLFDRVVKELLGQRSMAILSGPSFAKEVVLGLPTAVVVASNKIDFSHDLVERFNLGNFRVYISNDLPGVQLGGAIKNVIAVATGISDGLQYGSNARSALITRGLAEMMRLGEAMGAKQTTFVGLSGVGDLILTCTDDQSRNRRLGLALGKGLSVKAAEESIGQVVEGAHTASQINYLAEKYCVDMPICQRVYRILLGKTSPHQAVVELLSRSPKTEMV